MTFASCRVGSILTKLSSRKDCFCNYQFNVKACSIQGIFKTADVVKNDPDSVACPINSIDVMSKRILNSSSRFTPDRKSQSNR